MDSRRSARALLGVRALCWRAWRVHSGSGTSDIGLLLPCTPPVDGAMALRCRAPRVEFCCTGLALVVLVYLFRSTKHGQGRRPGDVQDPDEDVDAILRRRRRARGERDAEDDPNNVDGRGQEGASLLRIHKWSHQLFLMHSTTQCPQTVDQCSKHLKMDVEPLEHSQTEPTVQERAAAVSVSLLIPIVCQYYQRT